eukprot:gene1213-1374_t
MTVRIEKWNAREKGITLTTNIDFSALLVKPTLSGAGSVVSRSIVDLHGGEISVTSEGNNRGCVFTVTFPVSSPATAPSQPSGRRTSYLSPARSSMVGGWCSDEPLLVALPDGDKSAVPNDAGGSILPFLGDLTAGEVKGNAARSSSTVLSSMRHTFSDSVLRDNQDQGSVGQSTFPNSAATMGTTKTGFLSHDGIPLIRGDVPDQVVVYDL